MRSPDLVVVFDTNVLVLLSLEESYSRLLYERLIAVGGKVALTPQLYAEAVRTLQKPRLRRCLRFSQSDIDRFLQELPGLCLYVRKVPHVHGVIKADPDDDKILAAALAGHASYIVTEDRHLLDLGHW